MGRTKGIRNKFIKGNEIDVYENFAHVHIRSKVYGDKVCLIDPEDVAKISTRTWFLIKRPGTLYAYSREGSMHGFILGVKGRKLIPDHINGDGLNNMKRNLRPATIKENGRNRKKSKNSSSEYKGVIVSITARICVEGKFIFLGSFKTQKEAAIAYNQAALKYFGEFARLNVIDD